MKAAVPELVALIFAVWTLHHSKKFLQAMDASDKQAYLFQPHPVQVLRMLTYADVCYGCLGQAGLSLPAASCYADVC
jgi:hypothetical protein